MKSIRPCSRHDDRAVRRGRARPEIDTMASGRAGAQRGVDGGDGGTHDAVIALDQRIVPEVDACQAGP